MKTVLCSVLLLVVLSNFSFGQLSSTNFNPNILVHSQGLPSEFLLFVPDTATQILFNPARANDYSSSFVYTTYAADFKRNNYLMPVYYTTYSGDYLIITAPTVLGKNSSYASVNNVASNSNYYESFTSDKNPTVAVATLFNALNSKWLFLFTNGIAKQNGTFNNKSTNNNADSYYQANVSSSSSNSDSETKEGITSLRLSRIFSSGTGNGSVGLFAIFNSTLNNSIGNSSYNALRITNGSPLFYNSSINSSSNKPDQDNSQYVLGFEYALANEFWDNILRISYQKSTYNFRNKTYSNIQTYDSTYYGSSSTPVSTTNKSDGTNRVENYNQSKPYAFVFENYYQHKTTFFSSDANVFVSANAYYSIGDRKVGGNYFSGFAYYTNGTLTSQDTTSNSSEKKSVDKNWGITFTPGFILKKSFADLFLFWD